METKEVCTTSEPTGEPIDRANFAVQVLALNSYLPGLPWSRMVDLCMNKANLLKASSVRVF